MYSRMRTTVLAVLWAVSAPAQTFDFYGYGPYAPNAPRPETVLGYAIGERHSFHHQMEEYMKALAAALPQRVKMIQYGTSYEGRRTWLVMISAEDNMRRLDTLRGEIARLKDPRRTTEADARQIAASAPAVVWLNYANDGNESAAFEAGMQMAYQVAAGESADMKRVRDRILTIINPAHNPDSHERFVTWYTAAQGGRLGNPDPQAVEHRGDWLMDSNDYHFHIDPNRDAYALTQKESREIVAAIHEWNPQVFIDHHGNPPVMFFPPVALPTNANFPESTAKWETVLGKAIGAEFARYGWSFFNREVYDLFFPGYYDSYPTLNGATGMTFETDGGGSQGLRLERADKTHSSLRGGAAKHFTGSYAVLRATAENKEQRLLDFYYFRKTGMEDGARGPVRQYVLAPGERSAALVATLLRHQAEVFRATASFTAARTHNYFDDKVASKQFPAGSYVIPLDQPQKRLIQALLEKEAKLNDEFVKEVFAKEERNRKLGRRAAKEPYGFYDVTAWSLPLTFGVDAWWTEDRQSAGLERLTTVESKGGVEGGRAAYAYAIPSSDAALKVVSALLHEDYKLLVTRADLRIGDRDLPAGSFLARVERNPESLHQRVAELAARHGAAVLAMNSAWTESGPTAGSRRVVDLKKPVIAMAAYEPTVGRSYGHQWFLLEEAMGYPFTAIKTSALRNADLDKYDVIIFPDGNDSAYQELLGTTGVARMRSWIERGGVFIGIRGGAAFATRRGVEWTSSRLVGREPDPPPAQAQGPAQQAPQREPEEPVERTPGAILRAALNDAHFLTLGYRPEADHVVLHNSDLIFTASREGTPVISYAKENLKVSGFVWKKTETRLAGSAAVLAEKLGRGHVLLFAEDPNFRLVWPRWTRLFMNAVFLAPSLP
jgi:hypothetical protein